MGIYLTLLRRRPSCAALAAAGRTFVGLVGRARASRICWCILKQGCVQLLKQQQTLLLTYLGTFGAGVGRDGGGLGGEGGEEGNRSTKRAMEYRMGIEFVGYTTKLVPNLKLVPWLQNVQPQQAKTKKQINNINDDIGEPSNVFRIYTHATSHEYVPPSPLTAIYDWYLVVAPHLSRCVFLYIYPIFGRLRRGSVLVVATVIVVQRVHVVHSVGGAALWNCGGWRRRTERQFSQFPVTHRENTMLSDFSLARLDDSCTGWRNGQLQRCHM